MAEQTAQATVLALHGRRQTGEVFDQRLATVQRRLRKHNVRLVFVTAPCALPLEDDQSVAMHSWWPATAFDHLNPAASAAETDSACLGAWEQLCGVVRDAVAQQHTAGTPVVGVLGFSQGAATAALVLAAGLVPSARFGILAAGLWASVPEAMARVAPHVLAAFPLALPSLHFAGERDELVPPALSRDLAARTFASPQIAVHAQGHCVPSRVSETDTLCTFLQQQRTQQQEAGGTIGGEAVAGSRSTADQPLAEPGPNEQVQQDECEACSSIFGDDFEVLTRLPLSCAVTVRPAPLEGRAEAQPRVVFELPAGYPDEPPRLSMAGLRSLVVPGATLVQDLVAHLNSEAASLSGSEMMFTLADAAREWLEENWDRASQAASPHPSSAQPDDTPKHNPRNPIVCMVEQEQDFDHDSLFEEATLAAASSACGREAPVVGVTSEARRGKRWQLTVGLVGKPSAGKSTFFNGAAGTGDTSACARIGAFPFTTIDPNVGLGFYSVPCPCDSLKGLTKPKSDAPEGFTASGNRRIPVTVKDVAGLVPGAYQGRGKGNAFLNELCDADVLIHVVDVAAATDEQGTAAPEGSGSDPLDDIAWVRREVHQWIFDNVAAKWQSVLRRSSKFVELFSGYHAQPGHVMEAVSRMGLSAKTLAEELSQWTPRQLHHAVAHFLRVRFPIVLALNKADLATGRTNAERVAAALPDEVCVPVLARAEWDLCQLRRRGVVSYSLGATLCTAATPAGDEPAAKDAEAVAKAIAQFNVSLSTYPTGSGVQAAMDAACQLCAPVVVFPVADLETCTSYVTDVAAKSHEVQRHLLRDAVLMRPNATVHDLYLVLKRDLCLVSGDFVRAESRDAAGNRKVLRKEDVLVQRQVVCIMTNKKSAWQ
eukprot:m.177793 g.177793  ORF g.177793 m.177793 type:complete len:881 (+) comp17971_c0_seq4:220-2862(+)